MSCHCDLDLGYTDLSRISDMLSFLLCSFVPHDMISGEEGGSHAPETNFLRPWPWSHRFYSRQEDNLYLPNNRKKIPIFLKKVDIFIY